MVGAEWSKRSSAGSNDIDSSVALLAEREQPLRTVAEHLEGSQLSQDMRYRAGALRVALVADLEVVKARTQWRNPELKSRVGDTQPSVEEGFDAACCGGL